MINTNKAKIKSEIEVNLKKLHDDISNFYNSVDIHFPAFVVKDAYHFSQTSQYKARS